MNDTEKFFHQLGVRDCIAHLFMMIRSDGKDVALKSLAEQIIAVDKENPNPHAKWYLENNATPIK